MANEKYTLNDSELKLYRKSSITYTFVFFPLFGYTINKEMFYFWLGALIIGGILLARKSRLIKPEMRMKVMISEIIVTLFLVFWIFSNFTQIPGFIKEVVFFIVLIIFLYVYLKLLYNGKLTEDRLEKA